MTAEAYVEKALRNVLAPHDQMVRFAEDLRAHFREGAARGESPAQVAARLGRPEDVAAAFMEGVDLQPAGFFARLFAFLADAGILVTLAMPAFGAMVLVRAAQPQPPVGVVASYVLTMLAVAGVGVLYFPLLEGRYGRTPGKAWMRLRVVGEQQVDIGYGQAFLRRLSLYFELLAVDALFVPFTRRRQRAFDIVARTLVVHEPGRRAGAGRWLGCLVPWLVVAALAAVVVFLSPGRP
jgi:uncharacterized RDD family membrane protein YckC